MATTAIFERSQIRAKSCILVSFLFSFPFLVSFSFAIRSPFDVTSYFAHCASLMNQSTIGWVSISNQPASTGYPDRVWLVLVVSHHLPSCSCIPSLSSERKVVVIDEDAPWLALLLNGSLAFAWWPTKNQKNLAILEFPFLRLQLWRFHDFSKTSTDLNEQKKRIKSSSINIS